VGDRVSGSVPWRRFYKTVTVPNPAAGADWSLTVPASEVWSLVTITATLTTSAAVANRAPSLVVSDGNVRYARMPAIQTQAASLVGITTWGPYGQSGLTGLIARGILPVAALGPGETIGTLTDLIDVGDQWSAIFVRVLATISQAGPIQLGDVPDLIVAISNPDAS
jgi:hypothetical protein